MKLRLLSLASAAALFAATAAFGQSPFPPVGQQPQSSPFPSVGSQLQQKLPSTFSFAPRFGAPSQEPPCKADFAKLRSETERRVKLIQDASRRRAPPAEACNLLTRFIEADREMLTFVEGHQKACAMPSSFFADMRKRHGDVEGLRARVCEAASRGGPTQRIREDRPIPIWHDPPNCRAADCLTFSSIVENATTAVRPEDRA